MIQPTAKQCVSTTNLKSAVATGQLEEAPLLIEERQIERETASTIQSLGYEIKEIRNGGRGTFADVVMKRLKAIKAGIANDTRVSAHLNMIIDVLWPITIPEIEAEEEETETRTDSDKEITIRQAQAASSSTPDAVSAILKS